MEQPFVISSFRSEDYDVGKSRPPSEDTAEDFTGTNFKPIASFSKKNIQIPISSTEKHKQGL